MKFLAALLHLQSGKFVKALTRPQHSCSPDRKPAHSTSPPRVPLTIALWPLKEERAAGAPAAGTDSAPAIQAGLQWLGKEFGKGFRSRSRSRLNMMLRCQKRSLIIINPVIMRAIRCLSLLEMRAHHPPACSQLSPRHTTAAAAAPVRAVVEPAFLQRPGRCTWLLLPVRTRRATAASL